MVALAATLLVGCGGDDDGATSSGQVGPTTTGDEKSVTETRPPTTTTAPKEQALSLEQRHPNGTVLKVTGIAGAATSTTISIEAVNGFTETITLNGRGIHVRDDVGNRYNFVEPEQNADLELLAGATLTGSLTFLGAIDQKATALRLLVNVYDVDESIDLDDRYDRATSPEFQIDDIPVPR